jgi:hypothetical protein
VNWIPDLSAALPAPRDDEPPELRRRIVAEVRDHLECAFQRELLLTGDAAVAVRRVREKFGDPAKLACKLWVEAMKEKIVSQRLMLVCVAMLTAACAAMGIFSWKTAEQSALATQALVERLDRLVLSTEKQKSLDWVNVHVKLIAGDAGGPPPAGFTVKIDDAGTKSLISIETVKKSDDTGELDFGLLNPGRYNLRVSSPWGDELLKTIYVRAGESTWSETVICPPAPIEESTVRFDMEWPDDLKAEPLAVVIQVQNRGRGIGGERWHGGDRWHRLESSYYYVIDTLGNVERYSQSGRSMQQSSEILLENGGRLWLDVDHLPLPEGAIRMSGREMEYWCVGAIRTIPDTKGNDASVARRLLGLTTLITGPGAVSSSQCLEFNLEPGQLNHWKLRFPERWFEELRNKLVGGEGGGSART